MDITKSIRCKRRNRKISQIKEQAELIKGSAYINKKDNNKDLTKSDLLSEIANDKYFEGSVKLNDEVITANDKYKIEVDDDLNITVTEYMKRKLVV